VRSVSVDPLRPKTLAEFKGQPDISAELNIVLQAAKTRQEVPPHLLFSGPPGLGKTTLAAITARECGLPLVSTAAPSLEKPGDLVALLVGLSEPSVVFVDEIHQLPKAVEETLYSAMEDGRIDIVIGEGSTQARVIPMALESFTLVGATTTSGSLGAPFRDRFGYIGRLTPYDTPTLQQIVAHNSNLIGMEISSSAAGEIALRSRGTPRVANKLLRRVHDWSTVSMVTNIDLLEVNQALSAFGVDEKGLGRVDRSLLLALCENFNGGPVGLSTLAASVGESEITISEEHEPFLMRSGLLARTGRGRIATEAAWLHLDLTPPREQQEAV